MRIFFRAHTTKFILIAVVALGSVAALTYAAHSWGGYHWARTANPFTVKLGDNVSTAWDAYLATSSTAWSQSSVLDTNVVPGGSNRNCRPTSGRVEVCSRTYGFNGWLGVASIWVNGSHITQGTVKVNDTYFKTTTYNTPPWRRLVMCQEIGHTFGLDHQDEDFSNPNLGTCMDYTGNPSGPPSNEYPNAHDFEQLESIYSHLDSFTTLKQAVARLGNHSDSSDSKEDLGKELRKDKRGKTSLYEHDLGRGEKVFTFILWADDAK